MASGTGAQIALSPISSLYHSVDSVTQWTNFVSESLEHNLEELEEGAITGHHDAPPSHKGVDYGGGTINLEPNPNAIGWFLYGEFGISSGAVVTQAGSTGANATVFSASPVVQHIFTPRSAAYSELSFHRPFNVMVYKDVGSAFVFGQGVFTGIEFVFEAGQLAVANVDYMARDVRRMERVAAVQGLVSSGGRPWIWDQASVQIGPGVNSLAATTVFESLSIRHETPIEGVVLLDGTKKYGEMQKSDFRRVTIDGTLSFRNQSEYDAFVAYENRYLRLTATQVISSQILGNPASAYYFTMQLDVPLMKFLTWSTPVGGPNRLQTSITAKGERDDTLGYNIQAKLTNIVSAYA